MGKAVDRTLQHRGVTVPTFLYGTAWKEDRTQPLTEAALSSGFSGIDTANQRRHYYEEGVGAAVGNLIAQGHLQRGDRGRRFTSTGRRCTVAR